MMIEHLDPKMTRLKHSHKKGIFVRELPEFLFSLLFALVLLLKANRGADRRRAPIKQTQSG